jgi:hypothetical protein
MAKRRSKTDYTKPRQRRVLDRAEEQRRELARADRLQRQVRKLAHRLTNAILAADAALANLGQKLITRTDRLAPKDPANVRRADAE